MILLRLAVMTMLLTLMTMMTMMMMMMTMMMMMITMMMIMGKHFHSHKNEYAFRLVSRQLESFYLK